MSVDEAKAIILFQIVKYGKYCVQHNSDRAKGIDDALSELCEDGALEYKAPGLHSWAEHKYFMKDENKVWKFLIDHDVNNVMKCPRKVIHSMGYDDVLKAYLNVKDLNAKTGILESNYRSVETRHDDLDAKVLFSIIKGMGDYLTIGAIAKDVGTITTGFTSKIDAVANSHAQASLSFAIKRLLDKKLIEQRQMTKHSASAYRCKNLKRAWRKVLTHDISYLKQCPVDVAKAIGLNNLKKMDDMGVFESKRDEFKNMPNGVLYAQYQKIYDELLNVFLTRRNVFQTAMVSKFGGEHVIDVLYDMVDEGIIKKLYFVDSNKLTEYVIDDAPFWKNLIEADPKKLADCPKDVVEKIYGKKIRKMSDVGILENARSTKDESKRDFEKLIFDDRKERGLNNFTYHWLHQMAEKYFKNLSLVKMNILLDDLKKEWLEKGYIVQDHEMNRYRMTEVWERSEKLNKTNDETGIFESFGKYTNEIERKFLTGVGTNVCTYLSFEDFVTRYVDDENLKRDTAGFGMYLDNQWHRLIDEGKLTKVKTGIYRVTQPWEKSKKLKDINMDTGTFENYELEKFEFDYTDYEILKESAEEDFAPLFAPDMAGVLIDKDKMERFIFAGKAIFTIRNNDTGNRFTFRVIHPKRIKDDIYFVSVLTGGDNNSMYSFFGTIFDKTRFKVSAKAKIGLDSQSIKVFQWFWKVLLSDQPFPKQIQIWHEGVCGKCGKKLTVPESVDIGLGPVCARSVDLWERSKRLVQTNNATGIFEDTEYDSPDVKPVMEQCVNLLITYTTGTFDIGRVVRLSDFSARVLGDAGDVERCVSTLEEAGVVNCDGKSLAISKKFKEELLNEFGKNATGVEYIKAYKKTAWYNVLNCDGSYIPDCPSELAHELVYEKLKTMNDKTGIIEKKIFDFKSFATNEAENKKIEQLTDDWEEVYKLNKRVTSSLKKMHKETDYDEECFEKTVKSALKDFDVADLKIRDVESGKVINFKIGKNVFKFEFFADGKIKKS